MTARLRKGLATLAVAGAVIGGGAAIADAATGGSGSDATTTTATTPAVAHDDDDADGAVDGRHARRLPRHVTGGRPGRRGPTTGRAGPGSGVREA